MSALFKWKLALYVLAIFAAGSVTGWMLGAKRTKEHFLQPPRPEEVAKTMSSSLKEQLVLSPEQTAKVDEIMGRSSLELKNRFEAHLQGVRDLVNKRNAQIRTVLTPEQKTKFEEWEKQRREEWRPRHRGGGGRRGWQDRNPTNPPPPGPPPPPPPPGAGPNKVSNDTENCRRAVSARS